MYFNLKNRTVLITGASMEVAKAVALSMAAQGCNLHLVANNLKEIESTALESQISTQWQFICIMQI